MSPGAPNALELFVLGTGTAFPQADRGPTCQLLQQGNLKVAVDLGSGALQKLAAHNASPLELDAVLLSHAHLDHINDLMPLLFALNVPSYDRVTPLDIYASSQTWKIIDRVRAAWGDWLDIKPNNVALHTLDPGDAIAITKGDARIDVSGHAVSHTESSVGFRVTCGDVVLGLPSDSGPCDGLSTICRDADLAIVECSLPDVFAMETHLSPSSIIALAQASNVRELAIVHRYPMAMAADVIGQLTDALDIPVSSPDDGASFVFKISEL